MQAQQTDYVHVVCTHCVTENRVAAQRLGDAPKCGKCGAALLPGKPVELNDATYDTVIARTGLPVVVDYWAAWCGPCRAMAPILEEIASEYGDRLQVVKLDTDTNPGVAARYGITSIPTMNVYVKGELVKSMIGAKPKPKLLKELADYIG